MAKILPFARLDSVQSRAFADSSGAATGEIVIFPGVRIEYHHDHPTTPKGRPTGKGRRGAAKGALSA